MAENVDDVAACLVEVLGPVRPGRLQKLVYYAQAWHLADHSEPLFADDIEARKNGPVVRRLHDQRRGRDGATGGGRQGGGRQGGGARARPAGDPARLGQRAHAVLAWTVRSYGPLPDDELARIVRIETPWRLARKGWLAARRSGKVIDPKVMADYYRGLRTSAETAVQVAVGSARLEGYEFGPNSADRLREVATGTRTADDVIAELVTRFGTP